MRSPPIIDARHRLRWHQRVASDASTALLWSAWIWLWSPVVLTLASLAQVGVRLGPALGGAAGTLEHSLVALLGASGGLLVWKGLPPARRAGTSRALTVRDQARDLGLPEAALRAARDASICVVHHDAHGRIVGLEPRAQPLAEQRLSA